MGNILYSNEKKALGGDAIPCALAAVRRS